MLDGLRMAALDWIFLTVLGASLLIGAWRGLVFELLSLAGWVAAFFVAQWFADAVGAWLPMGQADAAWRHVAGFVLVFVAAVFASGFVAWLLKKLVTAAGLRPADRALGAMFGVLRGLVLLLAVALVVSWMRVEEAPWWRESQAAPWLQVALKNLRPVLPAQLGQHLPS